MIVAIMVRSGDPHPLGRIDLGFPLFAIWDVVLGFALSKECYRGVGDRC